MIGTVAAFLLSPAGRYLAAGVAAFLFLGGIYMKGRSDGAAIAEARAHAREAARVRDAVRAGDDAVRDPSRLRENDGHRRD